MIFLYISMVRSSYIIIVSGMGDDVPILGALVTHFNAMGNCCFCWCFYTSVWLDHHISSFYPVWEMTCQFWGLWWHFLTVKGNCCFWWCFYTSVWSDHHISSFYPVWEMTSQFWGLWWHFLMQWVTVVFDDVSLLQYGQIIICHHSIRYGRWRPNFGGSGDTF